MADAYMFLKLEGIDGEAQDAQFTNQIELESMSWGVTNSSSFKRGTGANVAKGDVHDLSFTKYADKASLNLLRFSTTGKTIPSGELTLVKLQGETKIGFITVKLTNIMVTSWNISGHGGQDLPVESGSLNFVKFEASYKPQGNEGDPAGNVDFNYDIQKQTS
jgi:type VI secretion system secreted protein Hcp